MNSYHCLVLLLETTTGMIMSRATMSKEIDTSSHSGIDVILLRDPANPPNFVVKLKMELGSLRDGLVALTCQKYVVPGSSLALCL